MLQKNKSFGASDYAFQDKSSVYLFTNENISGCQKCLGNLNGARVLTVASSGDHAFEAYMNGASHIDMFDINSYQRNVVELKSHMIRRLPYSDFMDFFFDKKNFWNPKIIAPIAANFSPELTSFMHDYETLGRQMFKYRGATVYDYELRHISYLTLDKYYYKLRGKLPERLSFSHCNLEQLSAKFNQRYDLIMLSNIFYYMYLDEPINEKRFFKFYKSILQPLAEKNLNDGGWICFNYMWDTKPANWSNFMEYFQSQYISDKSHVFSARSVISAFRDTDWDTVLLMQKKQR